MTSSYRPDFAIFTGQEAEPIFGVVGLKAVASHDSAARALSVQELLQLQILQTVGLLRLPAPSRQAIKQAAQWALWFGLIDVDGACHVPEGLPNQPDKDGIDEAVQAALGLAGLAPARFLLRTVHGGAELVADLPDAASEIVGAFGFFVDLKTLGHQLAEQAGRPLLVLWPGRGLS